MGGRASLLLVMGFSFILGYISLNLNRYATEAVGNMSSYNEATGSHNLALTGANVALAKFYQDTTWHGNINQSFTGAKFTGGFSARVITVGANKLLIRSISSYPTGSSGTLHDTVEVYFDRNRRNSFSIFAWMTDFEGNVNWASGDTVWGRVHSNGNLHVNGKPVFYEKVTTAKNMDPKAGVGVNKAIFKNSYETGVASIAFPTDLSDIINASAPVSGGKHYATDIWVTLNPGTAANNDGVAFIRSSQFGPIIDTVNLNDPAFSGVIMGDANVNVQGTLDGKLSIGSMHDIVIQDNVVYERNPLATTSDDILGLVANNNVVIADNTPNSTDVNIQAAIFSRTGSFTAENYGSRGLCGNINLLGSIVQKVRGPVGQLAGSVLTSGFSKRYKFDTRFSDPNVRPPYYPGYYVKTLAITNWWESYRVSDIY